MFSLLIRNFSRKKYIKNIYLFIRKVIVQFAERKGLEKYNYINKYSGKFVVVAKHHITPSLLRLIKKLKIIIKHTYPQHLII